jgi:hypothetical protein
MKVVVQNGVAHGLSRKEVEKIIPLFPVAWESAVDSIVLYQSPDEHLFTSYHPKERIIGLYWPRANESTPSKYSAIEELLVAMASISDTGQLPQNLSNARRMQYLDATSSILRKCQELISAQPSTPVDAPPKGVAPLS